MRLKLVRIYLYLDFYKIVVLALAVLSELFQLDGILACLFANPKNKIFCFFLERCVMRFLCSRSNDGILIDSMESLNKIFDRFKNDTSIARGIITLLKSMSSYGLNRKFSFEFFFLI
jgi:hypothetical protein